MKVQRTYPQPDSPLEHIGPRERAMAVFKYLADVEPESAVKHPLFPLIVAAFEQAGIAAIRKWAKDTILFVGEYGGHNSTVAKEVGEHELPKLQPSIVELRTGTQDAELRTPRPEVSPDGPFNPHGR